MSGPERRKNPEGAFSDRDAVFSKPREQIDDFNSGILLVELLVLSPPLPRNAVGQFSDFLGHGSAVIQDPTHFLFFVHLVGKDSDAFV